MVQVLVDVNWRPVFWPDQAAAPAIIREYCERADILKLSDEEAELLYGIPRAEALKNADMVQLGCVAVALPPLHSLQRRDTAKIALRHKPRHLHSHRHCHDGPSSYKAAMDALMVQRILPHIQCIG